MAHRCTSRSTCTAGSTPPRQPSPPESAWRGAADGPGEGSDARKSTGEDAMRLEERRMRTAPTEAVLPGRVEELEEISGASVPYDVDWASFDGDLTALNFVDNISCHRLNMA